ncbi:MAG: hypothetical protein JO161_05910 [Planctomycetaceae bacterium]|nr:hypothetical protein [Planctomycetaceae bacterium]
MASTSEAERLLAGLGDGFAATASSARPLAGLGDGFAAPRSPARPLPDARFASPGGGVYWPYHIGLLASGKVACWIAASPMPRLIVWLSEGTGSKLIGCPGVPCSGLD